MTSVKGIAARAALVAALVAAVQGSARAQEAPAAPATNAPTTNAAPTAGAPATSPPTTDPTGDASAGSATIDELLGQTNSAASGESSLRFYGFADFNAAKYVGLSDKWKGVLAAPMSFYVGKLNVYMEGNIAPQWKSLVEVRYLFTPNGAAIPNSYGDPITNTGRYNGTTADYSELGRPITWGGISIQRAYLEHNVSSYLSIRVGRFLTPWGIWNVDHGSPVIIGPNKPYVIGEGFFPEAQTGFDAFGSIPLGDATLGYHLTLSNGRGPSEEYKDLDGNKALGGRLSLKLYVLGELDLGLSGYGGTSTDQRQQVNLQTGSLSYFNYEHYRELAWAADVRWMWKRLHVQAEAAVQDRNWDDDARPVRGAGVQADVRRFGTYALVGYRLPWLSLMPYAIYSFYDTGDRFVFGGFASKVEQWSAGLNVRINPSVVFKLEYEYGIFLDVVKGSSFEDPLHLVISQLAWAF